MQDDKRDGKLYGYDCFCFPFETETLQTCFLMFIFERECVNGGDAERGGTEAPKWPLY